MQSLCALTLPVEIKIVRARNGELNMTIDDYLKSGQFEADDLGRIIIKDIMMLDDINGAIGGNPEFMRPDVASGNSNCVC